jgi:hypothetical protein
MYEDTKWGNCTMKKSVLIGLIFLLSNTGAFAAGTPLATDFGKDIKNIENQLLYYKSGKAATISVPNIRVNAVSHTVPIGTGKPVPAQYAPKY